MAGTLKARVSGAWVPVIGSGQEAAATARWNSAWGVVGQAVITANQGGTYTSATPITGATVTLTTVAGRRYRISWEGTPYSDVADAVAVYTLLRDGAVLQTAPLHLRVANQAGLGIIEYHDAPTAGSHTYSINLQKTAGTGNLANGANAQEPSTLTVLDVGPVTMASIAPPTAGPYVVAAGNALGIVAMGSLINNISIAANASLIVTNGLVFTPQLGRRYRLRVVLRAWSAPALVYAQATPFVDGSNVYGQLGDRYTQVAATGYQQTDLHWEFDGDGVQHTYTVQFTAGSTAALTGYPSPGGLFYIEDVGPNQSPALPLPATAPAWTPATLQSPWVPFAGGAWQAPRYRKIGDIVYIEGMATASGATGGSNTMFTLPVGFRPPLNLLFSTWANDNATEQVRRLNVLSTGAVGPQAAGTSLQFFAVNCSFSTTA